MDEDADITVEELEASQTPAIATVLPPSLTTPVISVTSAKINMQGIIEVVLKGAIIQPPLFRVPYAVDELDRLQDQLDSTIIENLWNLACGLVYHDVASSVKQKLNDKGNNKKDKGKVRNATDTEIDTAGKDMDKVDRFILYHNLMLKLWASYPMREDGNFILQYFYRDNNENGAWPPDVLDHWESILTDCRKNLKKWLDTDVCPLTQVQKEEFLFEKKVWVSAGYVID